MMVSLVPSPNGPEDGETDLNTGEGQLSSWLVIEGQVSGSTHLLVPPHHPQPSPVPMLTARQEVHEVKENAEQLYSVTEDEDGRMRSDLNTLSSPRMTPRGSIGYTTVPLLVQIRLILASIVEVPSEREIWRERQPS